MAWSRSDREMMPLTTSSLSTRTSRWTWDGSKILHFSDDLMTEPSPAEKNIYLSFDDAVDDGFQRFVGIALDHSLNKTYAPANDLLHSHVQIVVSLLGCNILPRSKHRRLSVRAAVSKR